MKVIIVGGVAGGATAAARIRRLDEQAEIVVYERSGFVSYANCGLPYYIGGAITDPGDLTLQTPESFRARFRIEMKVRHEVQSIVPEEKTVTVRNLETGETFTDRYDKLLLSPGARPTQPSLPGMDLERLFTLRTVEDALKIRAFVEEKKPRSAVFLMCSDSFPRKSSSIPAYSSFCERSWSSKGSASRSKSISAGWTSNGCAHSGFVLCPPSTRASQAMFDGIPHW